MGKVCDMLQGKNFVYAYIIIGEVLRKINVSYVSVS